MTHKFVCGPYYVRLARYGLYACLELQLPFLTLSISVLRR